MVGVGVWAAPVQAYLIAAPVPVAHRVLRRERLMHMRDRLNDRIMMLRNRMAEMQGHPHMRMRTQERIDRLRARRDRVNDRLGSNSD